jgi:hypothetical protein
VIVKTDAPSALAKRALTRTIIALEAAVDLDKTCSAADKVFFAEQRTALIVKRDAIGSALGLLDAHDENEGLRHQTRVEVGDVVLDDGLGDGKAKTKVGLRGQPGLDADHAFGSNIQKLQNMPLAIEPDEVLKAAARMNDLPAFPERAAIQANLIVLANQQKQNLADRAAGEITRATLLSNATRAVLEGVTLLLTVKGLLDARFPGQKKRVESFFLDVGRSPKPKLNLHVVAILAIFAAHKIEVSDEDRTTLTAETDENTLEKWLLHAVSVKSASELFSISAGFGAAAPSSTG